MNKVLKSKIVLKYGSQFEFARAVGEHEAIVSKVVRNRKALDEKKKREWASALECRKAELFGE